MTCRTCKLENLGSADFLKDVNNSLHPKCLSCKNYYCTDELTIFGRHKKCYDKMIRRNVEVVKIR